VGAGPASSEHVPDGIEPIVAYRVWVSDADLRLKSLHDDTIWFPNSWTTADCVQLHPAPDEHCACGLYSLKVDGGLDGCLVPLLVANRRSYDAEEGSQHEGALRWPTPILGRVHLAGKVIEHRDGYRSEKARVVAVLPLEGLRQESELVAEEYGVPLGEEIPFTRVGLPPGGLPPPVPPTSAWEFVRMAIFLLCAMAALAAILMLLAMAVAFVSSAPMSGIFDHDLGWSDWYFYLTVALGGLGGLLYQRFHNTSPSQPKAHKGPRCGTSMIAGQFADPASPQQAKAPGEPPTRDRPPLD
jgi:hypothetical protein